MSLLSPNISLLITTNNIIIDLQIRAANMIWSVQNYLQLFLFETIKENDYPSGKVISLDFKSKAAYFKDRFENKDPKFVYKELSRLSISGRHDFYIPTDLTNVDELRKYSIDCNKWPDCIDDEVWLRYYITEVIVFPLVTGFNFL